MSDPSLGLSSDSSPHLSSDLVAYRLTTAPLFFQEKELSLEVTFSEERPIWSHTIDLCVDEKRIELLKSVEGEREPSKLASPAFQQIHRQQIEKEQQEGRDIKNQKCIQEAIFLVGIHWQSHYSASVTTDVKADIKTDDLSKNLSPKNLPDFQGGPTRSIDFELACRVKEDLDFLGSTYTSLFPFAKIISQDSFGNNVVGYQWEIDLTDSLGDTLPKKEVPSQGTSPKAVVTLSLVSSSPVSSEAVTCEESSTKLEASGNTLTVSTPLPQSKPSPSTTEWGYRLEMKVVS
ncbi:MAG: hypothetical protein MPJ24_09395 [Pirellulaceae bacterium]|nr:hypothetical protein [Pirellulaceae bacterium]